VIEGCLVPSVALLGLVGNSLSIMVLHSPGVDMKVTFREVLTMLAVFDCIFISTVSTTFGLPQLSAYWKTWIHPHLFPYLLPFIQISLNGSIWSTVSVTVERYVSVVHSRHSFRSLSSAIYIIPVLFITIVWNIPRFGELSTCYTGKNATDEILNISTMVTMPYICPTAMRKNLSYTRDYILIANFIGMALIPFVILAVLNFKLYRKIKDSGDRSQKTSVRQKRDQKIASLLILIVTVFGCCNLVRILISIYEVFMVALYGSNADWPTWCDFLTLVSHFLLVFNSSSNIAIYCWKDEKFRKV